MRFANKEALFYTHEFLWSDLDDICGLLAAEQHPPRGLYTAALVLTFSCLEAYLNFLGETLYVQTWKDERRFFSRQPYKGTLGKLRFLSDELEVTFVANRRPYSTLVRLQSRRHQLVHPRLENLEERVEFTDAAQLQPPDSRYARLLVRRSLGACRQAVKESCNRLQARAFERYRGKIFSERAFTGVLGVRGISIET